MKEDDILQKTVIAKNINFAHLKAEHFKTNRITVQFLMDLSPQNLSQSAIIPFLLTRKCKKYPTFRELSKKLANLYDTSLYFDVEKYGDTLAIQISASSIDKKFTFDGADTLAQAADLLCEAIFNPLVEDEKFDENLVENEKRLLIERIENEINEKRSYALNKAFEVMCGGEPFAAFKYGTIEQARAITPASAYKAWKNMLENARVEIIVSSSGEVGEISERFKTAFGKINRTDCALTNPIIKPASAVKDENETMDIAQAKLVLGLRSNIDFKSDETVAAMLFTDIFGGGTYSKLFKNVREKMSLCYYCAARYIRFKGIVTVDCGVDVNNIELAKEAIMKHLNEMKNGEISNEEISAAKASATNRMAGLYDKQAVLESWHLGQSLDDKIYSPDEFITAVNAVTAAQIAAVAKKFDLDTIFTLLPKEGASDAN